MNYLVYRQDDQDVRVELGEKPQYSIRADDGIIRVWDEHQTRVISLDRLVILCIPNFGPQR